MENSDNSFSQAFGRTVDLGNTIADADKQADIWDVADGLLAGAIQFWLYARQPCGDPQCEDCTVVANAQNRMRELRRLSEQFAAESEYYHTPNDSNAGRA